MRNLITPILSAALVSAALPAAAEEQMTVSVPRLTMETAGKMAHAAINECRKRGISISVTIVDRSGFPQVQLRDTIAPPVSWSISRKKAYTALNFNTPTSQLENYAQSGLGQMDEGLAFLAGGLPIKAGGRLYGGIGVSGAPSGKTDEACAQAGIDAVIDDLEMM